MVLAVIQFPRIFDLETVLWLFPLYCAITFKFVLGYGLNKWLGLVFGCPLEAYTSQVGLLGVLGLGAVRCCISSPLPVVGRGWSVGSNRVASSHPWLALCPGALTALGPAHRKLKLLGTEAKWPFPPATLWQEHNWDGSGVPEMGELRQDWSVLGFKKKFYIILMVPYIDLQMRVMFLILAPC